MKKSALFAIIAVFVALVVVACGTPAAPPAVVQTSAPVIQTQIVEKVQTGAPVVQTQVVEKVQTVVVEATAAPAAKEKVLRINLGSYPDIVDPQKSSFVNEIAHLNLIYEGLTKFNEKLETVPGAAESWKYNDKATELTFQLRPGLKYSDGSLLNAARYKYSLMRNIDPHTAGEYAAITDEIAGAPEWRGADLSTISDEDLAKLQATVSESVAALDASGQPCKEGADGYAQEDCLTLKLTLSRPAPYFHTIMGIWVSYPAKQENIEAGGDIWWTSPKYQIGNGPFILKNMEPFVRARFEPNANYWGDKAKVPIEYAYITDSAVAFQAYKNNEFDIIGLAAEDLETVKADATLSKEANIYPGSCTFAVMFHQKKEPFTDQKVREAFAMALDRDGWVKDVLRGLGAPTLTWIPPGYPGYKASDSWGFDPDAAKKAIADSTYGSVDKLPEITDTFSDTPRNRTRNEWLVSKWKEVLGVDVKLNPVESTTYTALTKDQATAPQMFILGWCADYPDQQNWLSVYWKTGGFGERIAYSNPDFDKLVDEADQTVDPAKRADLYQQAQDLLIKGAPVAFMWNNVNSYLVKPWVTGLQLTPQDAGWAGAQVPTSIDIDASKMPSQ
ncbi:peptide ABC transporter substrate-binding protein [Anaerolineae bacterium CFX7]|nr:peptide ABC transporter substrate-binding protein [Anaerolineae bacterium CFX7]